MSGHVQRILRDLPTTASPAPPLFRPTALPNIWTVLDAEHGCVLKRSRSRVEARVYRYLVQPYDLPGPGLLHADERSEEGGCWLLLEPVDCPPAGLSPRRATHWWHNAARRDRAAVSLAVLHARFWNRPERVEELEWLPRYEPDDYWSALELLRGPPTGWPGLSEQVHGQLASAAEMLIAGAQTLIHGSFTPDNIGWRGDAPVFLDWEQAAWGPAYVDLGRLFSRLEVEDGLPMPVTPVPWRDRLVDSYRATLEAVGGVRIELDALINDVRNGMLWELAVDLRHEARDPDLGDPERYRAVLHGAEELADTPGIAG